MLFPGIPFRTLFRSTEVAALLQQGLASTDIRPEQLFPLRPRAHVYTGADYNAYEEARDSLLRSDCRIGRAALLSGGILWRLAIESLAPDLVLENPGELARAKGIGFTYWDHTGGAYVDDGLTDDEIRLIIGMYVCEPAERKNLAGYGIPSWWPAPQRSSGEPGRGR